MSPIYFKILVGNPIIIPRRLVSCTNLEIRHIWAKNLDIRDIIIQMLVEAMKMIKYKVRGKAGRGQDPGHQPHL